MTQKENKILREALEKDINEDMEGLANVESMEELLDLLEDTRNKVKLYIRKFDQEKELRDLARKTGKTKVERTGKKKKVLDSVTKYDTYQGKKVAKELLIAVLKDAWKNDKTGTKKVVSRIFKKMKVGYARSTLKTYTNSAIKYAEQEGWLKQKDGGRQYVDKNAKKGLEKIGYPTSIDAPTDYSSEDLKEDYYQQIKQNRGTR